MKDKTTRKKMSATGKTFEDLEERLEELYAKVECLIADNEDVFLINANISSANSVCAEMERLALKETNEERKKFLKNALNQHYAFRSAFDEQVSVYLSGKMSEKEVSNIVYAPRTLRSRTSAGKRSSRSGSQSSSVLKAKLVAKEELAKLKLKHLEQKQRLEREMQEEMNKQLEFMKKKAGEKTFSLELLQARQGLEEVSLERQVIEEEMERGGYLPPEEKNAQFQEPQVKWDLDNSNFPTFENQARLGRPDHNTVPKYMLSTSNQPEASANLAQPASTVIPLCTKVCSSEIDLPKIKILKFTGDPTNYIRFIKTSEANVERVIKDFNRRLLLLIQHCEGEPKKLIEFCLMLDPQRGYLHAKLILKDNFGRKNQIARAFIGKLHSDTKIDTNNEIGLVNLARDFEECELTFRELKLHSDINNVEAIGKVIKRLPYPLQNRWVRIAAEIEKTGEEPTIVDLVKFVKDEAEIVKSSYARLVVQKPKGFRRFATHATGVEEKLIKTKRCYLCFRNHYLRDCFEFRRKPLNQRIAFMRQNKLCDYCFKQGHIARFCRNDGLCTVKGCQRKHHRLLHRDWKPAHAEEDQSYASTSNPSTVGMTSSVSKESISNQVFLNIVPVHVYSKKSCVDTLAFLDQGSTTTLCDGRLLESLGISGEKTSYSITTVNQTSEQRNGRKANLLILAVASNETIELKNVYCVDKLPIRPNPKLTEDDLTSWPHLYGLEQPAVRTQEFQLLIGVDNPEVFWTLDERHGIKGDPFAVRTILGWSLLGGTVGKSNHNLNVNFVRTTNDLLQKQVECLWKLNNVPTLSCLGVGMSKNDRYAMKILEESQQYKDGHYQVGLLWRPGTPNLKSNYQQALHRLQTSKRRMQKDERFHNMYTTTMENYIAKGYARPLTNQEKYRDAKDCWYLPHHAVFHPCKPNKIRVVFDCAARQH